MSYIAGSHDWLKERLYRVVRHGPYYLVIDDETETVGGLEVCRALSHADAVRALLAARFSGVPTNDRP